MIKKLELVLNQKAPDIKLSGSFSSKELAELLFFLSNGNITDLVSDYIEEKLDRKKVAQVINHYITLVANNTEKQKRNESLEKLIAAQTPLIASVPANEN